MTSPSTWKILPAIAILGSTIGSLWWDWLRFIPPLIGILILVPGKSYERTISPLIYHLAIRKPLLDQLIINCHAAWTKSTASQDSWSNTPILEDTGYFYPPTRFCIENFTCKVKPWEYGIDEASTKRYRWIYSVANKNKCWQSYLDPASTSASDCSQKEPYTRSSFSEATGKPQYLIFIRRVSWFEMSMQLPLQPGIYQVTWYFKPVPNLHEDDVHKDTNRPLSALPSLLLCDTGDGNCANLVHPKVRTGWHPPSTWISAEWDKSTHHSHRQSALNKIVEDPIRTGLSSARAEFVQSRCGERRVVQRIAVQWPVSKGYLHFMEWNVERFFGNLLFGGVSIIPIAADGPELPGNSWTPFHEEI